MDKKPSTSAAAAKEAAAPAPTQEEIITKFKLAGDIAAKALKVAVGLCVAGTKAVDICIAGDKKILEETSLLYKKAKIEKGVAFPTCASVNHCVCHYSPMATEEKQVILADGDVVKIELGVHIDGYPAVVGQTVVVGASKEKPVTGRKADAIQGGYLASEASMRLIKAGGKTGDLPPVIEKIANAFQCKLVEGFTSHQMVKNVLDGEKTIFLRPSEGQKREIKQSEFAENEVYGVDILFSTGEGKPKAMEDKTTIFKKTAGQYSLKMKTSRAVYSEISQNFGTFGFNLRNLEDEKRGRLGIMECVSHGLVTPYDVLYEKEGDFTALFKYSIMITSGGAVLIAGPEFNQETVKSELSLQDEEIKKLITASLKKKAPKKKEGESSKAGEAAAPEEKKAE